VLLLLVVHPPSSLAVSGHSRGACVVLHL